MERHGGEDAYINIKYMVPTYESCLFSWLKSQLIVSGFDMNLDIKKKQTKKYL